MRLFRLVPCAVLALVGCNGILGNDKPYLLPIEDPSTGGEDGLATTGGNGGAPLDSVAGRSTAGSPARAGDAGTGASAGVDSSAAAAAGSAEPGCRNDDDCPVSFTTTPADCAEGYCEASGACAYRGVDKDADGHRTSNCLSGDEASAIQVGDDCDDTDPAIYPGAWDGPSDGDVKHSDSCNGKDNDCNSKPDDGTFGSAPAHQCECTSGSKSNCGMALGAKGNCAAGQTECVNGSWGMCSVQSASKDACTTGDDATCDGSVNVGCTCTASTPPITCGTCKDGTETCDPSSGMFGACKNAYTPGGVCTATNGCNGTYDCLKRCNTTGSPNIACTATNGCAGKTNCANQCITSGAPNQSCTASNGCPGKTNCDNACVTTSTPNQACTAANSCPGTTDCVGNCNASQSHVDWSGSMDKLNLSFPDGGDCSGGGCFIGAFNVATSPQFPSSYTFYFQTSQTGNVDNGTVQAMNIMCSDGSGQLVLQGNQICAGGASNCQTSNYGSHSITCSWGANVTVAKLKNAGGSCCGPYTKTVIAGQVVVHSGKCG